MTTTNASLGTLYLIPNTLGDIEPLNVLPLTVKKTVEDLDVFLVENEKSARRFIKKITPGKSQSKLIIRVISKYLDDPETINFYKEMLQNGQSVGVISEAGCPVVADPGSGAVTIAHQLGAKVVPLVGPSSILLALMASGFTGQSFCFNGYLPIDKKQLKASIQKLEAKAIKEKQTQLFMETPYRNNSLLAELIQTLKPQTLLSVAADLTLPTEWIFTAPVAQWEKLKIDLHKRPTMFSLSGE